jgi:hypothetical protein
MPSKYPMHKVLLVMVLFILVYGLGLIPSILIHMYITAPLLNNITILNIILAGFSLVLNFTVFGISEALTASFFIIILRLKSTEGVAEIGLHDRKFFRFTLFQTLYSPIMMLLYFMHAYTVKELMLRLLGAKIGKNVTLGGRIDDPALFELGDNSVIAGLCEILTHSAEGNKLIFKKIKMGKKCTLGQNSILLPGVVMEDNSIVGSMSLVPKNKRIPKGQVWGGVPAKRIK